jgi:hypothetical protein
MNKFTDNETSNDLCNEILTTNPAINLDVIIKDLKVIFLFINKKKHNFYFDIFFKDDIKFYDSEILKPNKQINSLINCLKNELFKNNEYKIAHRAYKNEIDNMKCKINEVHEFLS